MLLTVLVIWLILSVVTTVACAAIGRAGAAEERERVRVPELF